MASPIRTPEFRAEAVRIALTSGLPRRQVALDLGVGFSTLIRWGQEERRIPEKPTAQREALIALGVDPDRIYTDHGLTGRTRARPGLDQALAAVREGDTLVVTKLDRLARSAPDARTIADGLAERGIRLALGATVYDPTDPMGKMFFNILATFAEFESDLIRMRTREGMKIARAKGKLRGKKPKLSEKQHRELRRMYDTGDYSISDLADVFAVSRPTIYRTLQRTESAN